jgi:flavodoxin
MTTGKALIAFYSHTGSTTAVAGKIKQLTGGDLFQIETKKGYPKDYNETTRIAKEEGKAKARPELKATVQGIESYSVVYVGFPVWWGTMPMGVFTFLQSYDFTGKTVVPFCTHGGGGAGTSEQDLKAACPKSQVLPGLVVKGGSAASSDAAIAGWLKQNGLRQ